jgi:hypothetical protein
VVVLVAKYPKLLIPVMFVLPLFTKLPESRELVGTVIGSLIATTFFYFLLISMYFVVLYVCAACVNVVEFILRRVAEYPKGAIAAIGIVLTFISAILKASTGNE